MKKLPVPADEITRQAYALIERMDQQNFKRGQDMDIANTRLILTSPNGTRYQVVVSNAGALSTVAV